MSAVFAVCFKEIIDNLRDRQTVFYALLFGPLLLPSIVAGSLIGAFNQINIDFDEVTELPAINVSSAPNLVAFLRQNNIDTVPAPNNFRDRLTDGDIELVLEVPKTFTDNMRAGTPAPLNLYLNEGNKDSNKAARKVASLLSVYERTIDALRLQARGLDPKVFDSVQLEQIDVLRTVQVHRSLPQCCLFC